MRSRQDQTIFSMCANARHGEARIAVREIRPASKIVFARGECQGRQVRRSYPMMTKLSHLRRTIAILFLTVTASLLGMSAPAGATTSLAIVISGEPWKD